MRSFFRRSTAFCLILIHFIYGPSLWKQLDPQQPSSLRKAAPYTTAIPLSKSCGTSKQIAASRNVTHTSRYDDMSILASEVESISHVPSRRQIIITYRGKFCIKPYVIGRLSGLDVSLVANWTEFSGNNDNTNPSEDGDGVHQLLGEYNVHSKGIYYLEIIGLLCNSLTWDGEYRNVCLENPSYMRLTDDSAYIYVDTVDGSLADAAKDDGYWKWSNSNSHLNTYTPLHTRYQPEGCRETKTELEDRCFFPTSLDRFLPYQFSLHPNVTTLIRDKAVSLSKMSPSTTFCFVGLSHAREMAAAVNLWLQRWNVTSSIKAINLDAQFPRVVNEQFIQNAIIGRKCDKTVIAAGQWSVGRKPPGSKYAKLPPTLFPEYRDEGMNMISTLQKSGIAKNNIFLRSIHYNSLGDVKLSCPPQDWRHPAVIDQLNSIILNLTRSTGMPFIDTSHIIGPMWDSAVDFCHYKNDSVSSAEALYVLEKLLL
ncbi:hypothetical protein ACHAXN_005436 [Cyclotella atomus]